MNRRHFLAEVTAGTAVLVGGCLEGPTAAGDAPNTPAPTIESHPCPPFSTGRESAVCSHTVDPDSAPVYLTATPRTSPLEDGMPATEITLTLSNQSGSDLRFNPGSWRIWHLTNGEWTELPQELVADGVVTVAAGSTYQWTFSEAINTIQDAPELTAGLYAAQIGVPKPGSDDGWVACIALVQFEPAD